MRDPEEWSCPQNRWRTPHRSGRMHRPAVRRAAEEITVTDTEPFANPRPAAAEADADAL